jgi:hypothetical protein
MTPADEAKGKRNNDGRKERRKEKSVEGKQMKWKEYEKN